MTGLAALSFSLPAGAQSFPPPELLFVWPDRPAPGDEVVFTGQHLAAPGCTVKVVFGPNVEVNPKSVSGETLRVDVPPDARNGRVYVIRTCVEGSVESTSTSNPLPILVIWKAILVPKNDPALVWAPRRLLGGPENELAVRGIGAYSDTFTAVGLVTADGAWSGSFQGVSANDALTLAVASFGTRTVWLDYRFGHYFLHGGGYYATFLPGPYCSEFDWRPEALGFAPNGDLLLGAVRVNWGCPAGVYGLWRFPPGAVPTLDPWS